METKEIRKTCCNVLIHIVVVKVEVLAVLKDIKVDKSAGPNQVHSQTWEAMG